MASTGATRPAPAPPGCALRRSLCENRRRWRQPPRHRSWRHGRARKLFSSIGKAASASSRSVRSRPSSGPTHSPPHSQAGGGTGMKRLIVILLAISLAPAAMAQTAFSPQVGIASPRSRQGAPLRRLPEPVDRGIQRPARRRHAPPRSRADRARPEQGRGHGLHDRPLWQLRSHAAAAAARHALLWFGPLILLVAAAVGWFAYLRPAAEANLAPVRFRKPKPLNSPAASAQEGRA